MSTEDRSLLLGDQMSPGAKYLSNQVRERAGLTLHEGAEKYSPDMSIESVELAARQIQGPSSDDQFMDSLMSRVTGAVTDNSFTSGLKKGWEEEETWIGDAISYKFAAHGPRAFKEGLISKTHPARYLMSDAFVEVMEKVTGDDQLYARVSNMTEEERREFLKKEKQEVFNRMHSEVLGSPGGEMLGGLGKEILTDPTTVIGGTSIKALVTAGVAVGGLNAAFEGLAEEGEIDATDVAIGMGVGAAGGLGVKLIEKAGKKGINFIREKWTSRTPTTPEEIKEVFEDVGIRDVSLSETKAIDLDKADIARGGVRFSEQDLVNFNNLITGSDKPTITFKPGSEKPPITPRKGSKKDSRKGSKTDSRKQFKDKTRKGAGLNKPKAVTVEVADEGSLEINISDSSTPSYTSVPVNMLDRELSLKDLVDYNTESQLAKMHVTATQTGDEATKEVIDAVLDLKPTSGVPLRGSQKLSEQLSPESSTTLQGRIDAAEEADRAAEDVLTDQAGELSEMGQKYVGGNAASLDEAVEMLETGNVPVDSPAGKDLLPTFGIDVHFSDKDYPWQAVSRAVGTGTFNKLFSRPAATLMSFGNAGKRFAERLAKRREVISQRIGTFDSKFMKLLNDIGYKSMPKADKLAFTEQVKALARKSIPKRLASDEAVKVHSFLDKHFKRTLNEAVNTRVISPERYRALRKNYAENGYWPRIMNYTYLNTAKGKEHFIDTISNYSYSKGQAEKLLNTLSGNKWRKLQGITKLKNGTYRIDRNTAEELLAIQKGKMNDVKSNHLEKDRTLELPDDVLDPFLMKEMENVMISYNRDTVGKIVTNRVFGAKGELAARDILDIRKETGGAEYGKYALEVYYNSIGDNRGRAIKQMSDMSDRAKRGQAIASSFQTTKLITAQISNLTSAGVLLPVATSRMASSQLAGMSAAAKGIRAALSAEGWDAARKMGAITDNLIIQMQSEMGDIEKRLTTRYLKGIGFTASEEFNRVFAVHTGLALVDDLYEQTAKLAAKKAANKANKGNIKHLEKMYDTLEELGLPRDKGLTTVSDLERAAQRFSNKINFVASADQLPLTLQSPYARLFRQFQTYSLFYGTFLKDNVFIPLSKGNVAPLATLLIMASTAGSAVYDIKQGAGMALDSTLKNTIRLLKGESVDQNFIRAVVRDAIELSKDQDWMDRARNGLGMAGGIGIFGNYAEGAVQNAPGQGALTVLGPTASDFFKVTHGIATAVAELDPSLAGKAVLKTLPRGAAIADEVYREDAIQKFYK